MSMTSKLTNILYVALSYFMGNNTQYPHQSLELITNPPSSPLPTSPSSPLPRPPSSQSRLPKPSLMLNIPSSTLKTGDLLLYCPSPSKSGIIGFIENFIRWTTHSDIVHVSFVLKDPTFLSPDLKGTYIWESSFENIPDAVDGDIKFGVQIVPIEEVVRRAKLAGDRMFVRRLTNVFPDTFSENKLKSIYDIVHNKPYDFIPKHLIDALIKRNNDPQHTNRFICSALVGYIYTKCNILHQDTNWSILLPEDFTPTSDAITNNLIYISNTTLEESMEILKA
jgi:hypothetical protein